MKFLPPESEEGVGLIEVLIALFIIALVILGGGMFFFYGRVFIVREAHRRAAVLVASQRLEELKATDYDEINFDIDAAYYIAWNEGNWCVWNEGNWYVWNELGGWQPIGNPPFAHNQEPVDVDNLSKGPPGPTMVTKAECVADDGGSSHDYLKVTVTVNWHDSTTKSVSSTTLIAP